MADFRWRGFSWRMPWVTFTEDDIKSRLAVRELDVYEATAGEESDGSPATVPRLPIIRAQVLAQVRGAVRSNPRVDALGPEGTMPDFCVAWAAVIARAALVGLSPVPEGMTDPRRDEYRDALKGLESLRSMHPNAFVVEDPSPVADTAPSYGGNPLLDF